MKPMNAILIAISMIAILECSLVLGSALPNANEQNVQSNKDDAYVNSDNLDIPVYQEDSDDIIPEDLVWADFHSFKPMIHAKRDALMADKFIPSFYNYLRFVEKDSQKAKKGFNPQTRWGKRSSSARFNPQTRWG